MVKREQGSHGYTAGRVRWAAGRWQATSLAMVRHWRQPETAPRKATGWMERLRIRGLRLGEARERMDDGPHVRELVRGGREAAVGVGCVWLVT